MRFWRLTVAAALSTLGVTGCGRVNELANSHTGDGDGGSAGADRGVATAAGGANDGTRGRNDDASASADGSAGDVEVVLAGRDGGAPFLPGAPRPCARLVNLNIDGVARVVKNGDGFASNPSGSDAGASGTAGRLVDLRGGTVGELGQFDGVGSRGFSGAGRGGGVTTALAICENENYPCGVRLVVDGAGGPVETDLDANSGTYGIYDSFAMAVREDGRTVLVRSMGGYDAQGDLTSHLDAQIVDEAGIAHGRVTLHVPYTAASVTAVAVDAAHRVAVVIRSRDTGDTSSASATVLHLDSGLHQVAEWTAPDGVAVQAIDVTLPDEILVAGSIAGSAVDMNTWLAALDTTTLAPLWQKTGDEGSIDDVSVSGGVVVLAGEGYSDHTEVWVATASTSGATLSGRITHAAATGSAHDTSVQVQSDGVIALTSEGRAYRCTDAPALDGG